MTLQPDFNTRLELIATLREQFPASTHDPAVSETHGGRRAAESCLTIIRPSEYAKTRNFLDGAVTHLSPYLRHGILSLAEVRDHALRVSSPTHAEKLINELCWRDYWQRVYRVLGDDIWQDLEAYKTGFSAGSYARDLPEDIRLAQTPSACMNQIITLLYETGYLHNRLRMYLAAYIVHWRRVRWQAGANWFLEHLLDGDPASNNLSWQWVASTFGSKPYVFNQKNMRDYMSGFEACTRNNDPLFAADYDEINVRLFPNGVGSVGGKQTLTDRLRRVPPDAPRPTKPPRQMHKPLIWVHGDNLNPHNEALTQYPNAPAVWVWDDELLERYRLSLKRVVFITESLLETRAELRRGDVATQLTQAAQAYEADGIVTMDSPSPRFRAIVRALEASYPVQILQAPQIVTPSSALDLRRFSRYWESVRDSALSP
ncbi:MAG: FAD-binding domain-containing protein [Phototrophicaceae bacterium]